MEIPTKQRAVQLTGPDELKFNPEKEVFDVGPYQILAKVEAVGLCFSDLKLLKQFTGHARKSPVTSGLDKDTLNEIPSYAPNENPTVPGHEAVVRVVKVGEKVKTAQTGKRYLVQTDYRWLPTAASNAAFGYNFEGALQQYTLMDERVIISPDGDSMLIPASDSLSASAVALVEPWACVEDAYAVKERTTIKKDGTMLAIADTQISSEQFNAFLARFGKPAEILLLSEQTIDGIGVNIEKINDLSQVANESIDDVIYFGSNADTAEKIFPKVATNGLVNFTQCSGKFGREIACHIGRVHYSNIRIIGTTTSDPAESMQYIPDTGEIRQGDKVDVVGAGGPMGVMHVVRNICQGVKDVTVYAGDLDDERLEQLSGIAKPLAEKNNIGYVAYNPTKSESDEKFDYIAIMAPVYKLVSLAVERAAQNAIVNIFAGIAANVEGQMDFDTYIEKQLYFIGTSGSTLDDMKTVLAKVESGSLDTNISVAAVSGIEHAIEGIRAVENHQIPGKIIVYPDCVGLPLTTLDKLTEEKPEAAENLNSGLWTKAAETALIS